jgi:hypothetical protein
MQKHPILSFGFARLNKLIGLFAMNMPKRLDMKILGSHTANIDAKNNHLLPALAIV